MWMVQCSTARIAHSRQGTPEGAPWMWRGATPYSVAGSSCLAALGARPVIPWNLRHW